MLEREFDLVIGIHSIIAAIENSERKIIKIVGTEEGLAELKKKIKIADHTVEMYASHKVQEESKKYFRDLELDYQRVPSGVFLIASPLALKDVNYLYEKAGAGKNLKILCLDQISDVHNAAAILRTASFYGVDAVIVPDKRSFGLTPSFFRIASGAAEFVPLVGASKLTKVISKLKGLNVLCLALSEHAKGDLGQAIGSEGSNNLCLILGKEDVGISNAVLRIIDHHIVLESSGGIKSLNVAAAAAIAMEKCFK